ncbi:uncharacterized protein LOC415324 isoform X11 [Gallus gallus]|uniref:uncharacterized protein LOC415324 isoform X11 n=1 Tax=Gallus gallus TaxID=9031 RepID=UPI001AE9D923|nr:uncharacterized protein LOC415324 isoform X11 [Gallus gallus]XP_046780640.1 uncharacterized protein LOC415324 isoform X11 [Gallus gallus]
MDLLEQAGSGLADPQVSSLLRTLQDKVPTFLQPQYWLRSWMWQVWMELIKAAQVSSSKQAVAGAASTAAFFLCEGLLGQHFDVVPNGVAEPQPGDLFLFPLASGGPGWWGAHAGVYCGDGEIIHLEASPCDHQPSLKAIPSTTQAPQEHPQQGLWPSMVRATS